MQQESHRAGQGNLVMVCAAGLALPRRVADQPNRMESNRLTLEFLLCPLLSTPHVMALPTHGSD